jgi:hypothetical protein
VTPSPGNAKRLMAGRCFKDCKRRPRRPRRPGMRPATLRHRYGTGSALARLVPHPYPTRTPPGFRRRSGRPAHCQFALFVLCSIMKSGLIRMVEGAIGESRRSAAADGAGLIGKTDRNDRTDRKDFCLSANFGTSGPFARTQVCARPAQLPHSTPPPLWASGTSRQGPNRRP